VTDDPERLLAEALRAQAVRTPLPQAAEVTHNTSTPPGGYSGYGLLSGSDVGPALTAPPVHQEFTVTAGTVRSTSRIEPRRRVPVPVILLLAVVLGLAAGAVAGLLTLL
jgi:hypothetical protein